MADTERPLSPETQDRIARGITLHFGRKTTPLKSVRFDPDIALSRPFKEADYQQSPQEFEAQFELIRPRYRRKWKAFTDKLQEHAQGPKRRQSSTERRAVRHALRPPTLGYWAKRCTCSACHARKGIAVVL